MTVVLPFRPRRLEARPPLAVVKEHGGWQATREISRVSGKSMSATRYALRTAERLGFVRRRRVGRSDEWRFVPLAVRPR